MLLRNLQSGDHPGSLFQEMAEGLPMIGALARLCGHAIAGEVTGEPLSRHALAIVAASGPSGGFEIRGDKDGFETAERMLAVCVEVDANLRLLFRDKSNPRTTLIFLDGFAQLCRAGHIMHHLMKDFSLSKSGFELADSLDRASFADLHDFAVEIEH